MIFMRSFRLVLVGVLCLVALPASSALAATPARPTVSSMAPLTLGIGDMLTIRGRNFLSGKDRNRVAFRRAGAPAIFVKAAESTRTRIKVVVPQTLVKYLAVKDGAAQATRFRVRVLARRFQKDYSALKRSPLIGPSSIAGGTGPQSAPEADCDADGVVNSVDGDDDNDLLSDTLEVSIKTNPCNADSDGDGLEDGFEYQSALDLNNHGPTPPLPYAGKRPYANALDGTDAATDYDGDGLTAAQEHSMWKKFGTPSLVLSYSAGLKRSVAGSLNDDLRDVDSDGLGNWDEFNGRMTPTWWKVVVSGEAAYTEAYDGTSAVDADSDGDGVNDGDDDIDHDGWSNLEELSREVPTRGGLKYRVQPFNPCLPDYTSATCSEHPPISGSYPPFDAAPPLPPAPIVVP